MAQKNWKELLIKYKGYLLIIVILLVLVITLVRGCGRDEGDTQPGAEGATVVGDGTEDVQEENKLEENTHASVERLLTKFLDCMMEGDVDALEPIVDYLSDENKEKIISRARMYDSYDNLKIFTKDGPEPDSYIAYLCFDIKFVEIVGAENLLPDVLCLYVSPKDGDGNRYIRYDNVENDEELQAYVKELEEDPEVKALYDDVKTRFAAALESDEKLNKFYMDITGQLADAEESGEEAPAEETAEEGTSEENTEEASEEPAAEETSEATAQNRETRVTESVNVRAQASTESERLALAYQGDPITQIESYADGWSKVEYKGLTGYVKTEFLE